MSSGQVQAAIAVAGALAALIGLLVRFMLIPYLRDQIVTPLHATQAQVTPTEEQAEPSTVPDQIAEVKAVLEQNTAETVAVARMFEGHLRSSDQVHNLLQGEVDRIWRHLRQRRG